ncbi:hypothetical protein ABZ413_29575 [Nocardia rhamnosiphila]|uniref:hypothetical protein n=1 Tax=Nocardia rhamnosiphila TaxID=426716 RepID=UPI0033EC1A4B
MASTARTTAARQTAAKPAAPRLPKAAEDVAALNAAQEEATAAETMIVEWGGLEFEVIRDPDEWDFFSTSAPLAQGNIAQGLIGILGNDQVIELRKAYPRFTQRQARELYTALNEALGFGSGN